MKSNQTKFSLHHSRSAVQSWRTALILAAVAASSSLVGYAQLIVNPNFTGSGSGGFTPGWSTAGDASVKTATFNGGSNPSSGFPFDAVVTTINSIDLAPVSGVSAVTANALESFLGLVQGTLSNQGRGTAEEGSGILQTINGAKAGDTFTFKWNFYTSEDRNAPVSKDYAFFTLHEAASSSSVTVLADPTSGLHIAPGPQGLLSPFSYETGYKNSSTITIPSDGNWTIGFGVVENGINPATDSALALTGFAYTPVPEPWAWSLATGLALGAVALGRRLRPTSAALS